MPPDKPLYGLLNCRFWSKFTISAPLFARLCRFLSGCPSGTTVVTAVVICLHLRPSIHFHVTYCVKLYQLLNICIIEREITPCSKVPPRIWWLFKQPRKSNSNIYRTRYNVTQFILSGNCSTCFGCTSTHQQECKQLYLQHLVFVTPLLLSATIVEELELVWVCCGWRTAPTTRSNRFQLEYNQTLYSTRAAIAESV